ncbi:hypothetical protein K493DRAFT_109788 [Basidiobolus meristosporus CBS 931.73]|uniref:Uncharacterized protein n=1 Tax=Basidiobolus meristosporus CBS 931.73 TaxID=1314790 RepID=A0A1Y1YPL6_9FUNG|nr:hypothetical protein K493DRAFT_109788 [Basidiobolus meristosporus CBS 931.73]|eukprot:ORX99524.1 hypothetical protein K493DRAFT_109788 [Basidiobolus meristosporus CBS 931.73]
MRTWSNSTTKNCIDMQPSRRFTVGEYIGNSLYSLCLDEFPMFCHQLAHKSVVLNNTRHPLGVCSWVAACGASLLPFRVKGGIVPHRRVLISWKETFLVPESLRDVITVLHFYSALTSTTVLPDTRIILSKTLITHADGQANKYGGVRLIES